MGHVFLGRPVGGFCWVVCVLAVLISRAALADPAEFPDSEQQRQITSKILRNSNYSAYYGVAVQADLSNAQRLKLAAAYEADVALAYSDFRTRMARSGDHPLSHEAVSKNAIASALLATEALNSALRKIMLMVDLSRVERKKLLAISYRKPSAVPLLEETLSGIKDRATTSCEQSPDIFDVHPGVPVNFFLAGRVFTSTSS